MVGWKEITTGLIITIVLTVLFGVIAGSYGAYLGIIVAGFATGYLNNEQPLMGVVKGAMIGLIAGCIMALIAFALTLIFGDTAGFGAGLLGGVLGIGSIVYLIVVYSIFAAMGGTLGELIVEGRNYLFR